MRAFVGVTDGDWFEFLAAQPELDEVNFWQPGGSRVFRALEPGGLFLFKLHSPNNFVVGGGLFGHATLLPVRLAWESFGIKNGVRDLLEMQRRIDKYRRSKKSASPNDPIGCILLEQPFFFPRRLWIPIPEDWSPNIVSGKGYDLTSESGISLYRSVQDSLAALGAPGVETPLAPDSLDDALLAWQARFGKAHVRLPRLGQGSFRVLIMDAYERRCAVTGERTLPALEAAHVRPYAEGGEHRPDNGLLLRRDLHALFDQGYLTVTPSLQLEVSRRIREEFENGRDYYALHGSALRAPQRPHPAPAREALIWHNERVFKG